MRLAHATKWFDMMLEHDKTLTTDLHVIRLSDSRPSAQLLTVRPLCLPAACLCVPQILAECKMTR